MLLNDRAAAQKTEEIFIEDNTTAFRAAACPVVVIPVLSFFPCSGNTVQIKIKRFLFVLYL